MMANQGAVCSRLSVRRQLFVTTVRQRLFLSCLFLMHFYLCSNISIRQPPFVPRQVQAGQLFFLKLEGKQEHSHSFSLSLSPLQNLPGASGTRLSSTALAQWSPQQAGDGSLISWLQSLSAVILEPKERKFVSVSTFPPIFATK